MKSFSIIPFLSQHAGAVYLLYGEGLNVKYKRYKMNNYSVRITESISFRKEISKQFADWEDS